MLDPTKKRCPTAKGKGEGPSKTVGEVKSPLESTPYPPEVLRGIKQTLCALGPRGPTETEPEVYLSVSCRGPGQQWLAAGARALGAADVGMA